MNCTVTDFVDGFIAGLGVMMAIGILVTFLVYKLTT